MNNIGGFTYSDLGIILAGVMALAAVFTYFGRPGTTLTLREHEAYQKSMEAIIVDIDRRLTRLENKLFNGPPYNPGHK